MPQPAIAVRAVSKQFRRGAQTDLTRDLLQSLSRRTAAIFRGDRRAALPPASVSFWNLHDVSFEVAPGEAFGIIGPNGAGKSTLLKLLAGILRPDSGNIEIARPLSALIELGAGFHGDLTGRENIFLNAAILGMSRRDIRARLAEIIEFAGIGDALDTPVKWYSSGMYARLGFAVAAHVSPRVLLVDEVLSVGDRSFRAKCMARMNDFLREGVAVLFVSHDVASVQRFCHRALVLQNGRPTFLGSAADAVLHYHDACIDTASIRPDSECAEVTIHNLRIERMDGNHSRRLRPGDSVQIQFDADFHADMLNPSYGLSLMRAEEHLVVFETSSTRMDINAPTAQTGHRQHARFDLQLNVPPGQYALGLHVRARDSATYAVHTLDALRINVQGLPTSTGPVHLDPKVTISCTGRHSDALASTQVNASHNSELAPA